MRSHVINADAGFVYIVCIIHKSCQADRIDNRLSCHQDLGMRLQVHEFHAVVTRLTIDIAVNDNCRLMTITTACSPRPLDDSPATDSYMFHASDGLGQ